MLCSQLLVQLETTEVLPGKNFSQL